MPLTPEEVEAQLEELREGQKELERRLRSSRAFTSNPAALSTDLDDLGSVKTYLTIEKPDQVPGTPPADVSYLYGYRTRRVPMVQVASPSSNPISGTDFYYSDGVSDTGRFAIPVPSDWVPNTDITLNLLVFKLAAGNAVVVLESSIMTGGAGDDFSASAWNVENATACGRTLTNDIMSQVTRTVAAAFIATTKNLHWALKRLGADAADTVNASVFSYYGPWIEYTAGF